MEEEGSPSSCDSSNREYNSLLHLSPKSSWIVKTLFNNEKVNLKERQFLRNELNSLSQDPNFSRDAEIMREITDLQKKVNSPGPNTMCFKPCSQGPFIVIAQKQSSEAFSASNTNIHPMLLGRILNKHGVKNIVDSKRNGGNRLSIEFSNFFSANDFLSNTAFEAEGFSLYIPRHLVSVQGLVWDVDPSLSNDEILKSIESPFPAINFRRISKRVIVEGETVLKPTTGIVISWEGTVLPKKIKFNYVQREVKIYIPPAILCMKCLRYGHTKNILCKSKERCVNCGLEGNCGNDCTNDTKCVHCEKNHAANSRICEEFLRQKKLREIMVFENISLFEANKRLPKPKPNNTTNNSPHEPLSIPQQYPTLNNKPESIPGIVPIQHRAHHSRSEKTLGGFSSTLKKSTNSPSQENRNNLVSEHNYSNLLKTPFSSNPHKTTDLEKLKRLVSSLNFSDADFENTWHSIASIMKNLNSSFYNVSTNSQHSPLECSQYT